jgi:hypothetical protein
VPPLITIDHKLIFSTTAPFLTHYYSVEIYLYEIGLSEAHQSNHNQNFQRLEHLYACLLSAKSYLEAYFLLPTASYSSLSFVTWAQLANTLSVLARLLLVESEGWDLAHAREVADFATVLERLIERFQDASNMGEASRMAAEEEDTFYQYSKMMQWVKSSYELTVSVNSPGQRTNVDLPANEAMTGDFMYLHDVFWQDFVGDWGGTTL